MISPSKRQILCFRKLPDKHLNAHDTEIFRRGTSQTHTACTRHVPRRRRWVCAYEPAHDETRRRRPPERQSEPAGAKASGHGLGRALLLRGIGTLVRVRRRVQEVAAHVEGERQQAAVQVHHHVLLVGGRRTRRNVEEGARWGRGVHTRTNRPCD